MKIKNSTNWPDRFLRRMVAWCCREIGMPVRTCRHAEFRNRTTRAWSGHAWWARGQRIVVSIGPDHRFPARCDNHYRKDETFADRIECLVAVAAHELYHLAADDKTGPHYQRTRAGGRGSSERATCYMEWKVLDAFRANRDVLLAQWSEAEPTTTTKTKQQKNAERAEESLARWQRKLKLAQTKVRQYRAKVRRYERIGVIAACKGETR